MILKIIEREKSWLNSKRKEEKEKETIVILVYVVLNM
jgi:hypothetical protein